MPQLTIDQRKVEVPPGATVLFAARKLGIDIPALCFLNGHEPMTSCLVCMVKIRNGDRLVPSCGTVAEEGMEIESETEEIHQVRRSALELLLSDHLGDCLAPCYFGCPARMDIPQMLRQIAAEDFRGAIATVKSDIALPAVLGRICPAPCEKVCRRRPADGAVAICRLKRFVAEVDLASDDPYLPHCRPASDKRVAIVGAGPAGLAAAYYLRQQGHGCTILDQNDTPGGRLLGQEKGVRNLLCAAPEGPFRQKVPGPFFRPDQLPPEVLHAEIEQILRLQVELRMGVRVAGKEALRDLRSEFDAILVCGGTTAKQQAESWGLKAAKRGLQINRQTYETNLAGVFAAGGAIRSQGLIVRSVADGKEAAGCIDQYLSGLKVAGAAKPFNTRLGQLEPDELSELLLGAGKAPRRDPVAGPHAGFPLPEATEQAARCMHCDCRKLQTCKLRKYSQRYAADPRRYQAQRRAFQQDRQHSEVIYEPGKCIDCGLCVEIARAAGEPLGLTFVGRGFDVRVGVPLKGSLREALGRVAAECIGACPTAALSHREQTSRPRSPRTRQP